jgi:enoyl-CoA hydratase
MTDPRLTVSIEGPIAILAIDRTDKANALDIEMLKLLASACDEIDANAAIRVAILTGTGKAFSAGGDIKAWAGMTPEDFGHSWVRFGHRVFERLATLRMPLVAAINGHALGGGLELAACADIRIAESQVRIGMPETSLGMVPGWSGTQRLAGRFGAQMIRRMVLGGEVFSADEALSHGLVDAVVETGGALDAVKTYAERVAARGPAAIEISKLMLAISSGEDNGAAVEALGSILVAKTGDLKEGVAAFSAKRQANFKGEWS